MPFRKRDEALHIAVQKDDHAEAERLLKGGFMGIGKANPNAMNKGGFGAPHWAQSGKMVDLLCGEHKADPNLHGSYYEDGDIRPIHNAPNAEVTKALRNHGADILATHKDALNNALHYANSPEQVDAIVEGKGIELLNQCNRYRKTPLDTVRDPAVQERIRHHGGKTMDELDAERKEAVAQKKIDSPELGSQGQSREL